MFQKLQLSKQLVMLSVRPPLGGLLWIIQSMQTLLWNWGPFPVSVLLKMAMDFLACFFIWWKTSWKHFIYDNSENCNWNFFFSVCCKKLWEMTINFMKCLILKIDRQTFNLVWSITKKCTLYSKDTQNRKGHFRLLNSNFFFSISKIKLTT